MTDSQHKMRSNALRAASKIAASRLSSIGNMSIRNSATGTNKVTFSTSGDRDETLTVSGAATKWGDQTGSSMKLRIGKGQ
jgi:hypothetical protein